jgi:hypothetical protein
MLAKHLRKEKESFKWDSCNELLPEVEHDNGCTYKITIETGMQGWRD